MWTEMEMVFPGTISPEVLEFRPLISSSFVLFCSGRPPLPLVLAIAMGMVLLSCWEAFPTVFECPLSRFEPRFLGLGSGAVFPRICTGDFIPIQGPVDQKGNVLHHLILFLAR